MICSEDKNKWKHENPALGTMQNITNLICINDLQKESILHDATVNI